MREYLLRGTIVFWSVSFATPMKPGLVLCNNHCSLALDHRVFRSNASGRDSIINAAPKRSKSAARLYSPTRRIFNLKVSRFFPAPALSGLLSNHEYTNYGIGKKFDRGAIHDL